MPTEFNQIFKDPVVTFKPTKFEINNTLLKSRNRSEDFEGTEVQTTFTPSSLKTYSNLT